MSFWSRIERRISSIADELLLDDHRFQISEAEALLARDEPRPAAEILAAVLADKPDHTSAASLLGIARLELGDAVGALVAFETALAARADLPEALLGRGEALLALGRWSQAIEPFLRAVDEARGVRRMLAAAYRGLGLAYRRTGDADKAVRELRKAVAEDADDPLARAALGEALLADERVARDEARRHLEQAAAAASPPAIAFLGLGRLALADELASAAEPQFRRALEIAQASPFPGGRVEHVEAHLGLGETAMQLGDAVAAHEHLLRAIALEPRRAELHARLGDAHRMIGSAAAALQSYERALALGGGDDVRRRALDSAVAAGELDTAVRLANELLATDASETGALVARALAFARDGQLDAARATLRHALHERDDPAARCALGRIELEADPSPAAGRRASDEALAALRLAPEDAGARALLAEARGRELALAHDAPTADASDMWRVAAELGRLAAGYPAWRELVGDAARVAAEFDQPLLVTVMGEFSSGKSSFVNAFVGAEVAPTGITPTTATINVLKYGRERGGRLVYRNGTVETLAWEPLFRVLREIDEARARELALVEILVPLPQLERVNLVDTPGLNSIQPEHEATARGFIARADAVVWLFTANQAGKSSERKALDAIRAEGKRVLSVLNKRDQLSEAQVAEVVAHVEQTLGDAVEIVVPFSARQALAHKMSGTPDDGNWAALERSLEERFFTQARQLKRAAADRRIATLIERARAILDEQRRRIADASNSRRSAADELRSASVHFIDETVAAERRALLDDVSQLHRRAAREVLELVRPRRLPFGQHSATGADRDYLLELLDSGYQRALATSHARVIAALRRRATAALQTSAGSSATATATSGEADRPMAEAGAADLAGDLARTADDAIRLVGAQVYDRTSAFLRGYLHGGYVDRFFRQDLPRVELAEDAVYHALIRDAPDLDAEIAVPLARAGAGALAALADRLGHWAALGDVGAYDLEVGLGHALATLDARRRAAP